jgi:hypothetical protein
MPAPVSSDNEEGKGKKQKVDLNLKLFLFLHHPASDLALQLPVVCFWGCL